MQTCNDAPQPAGGGSNNVGSSSPVDAVQYSLDDSPYYNGTPITVPVTCPEGMVCEPNTLPPIVTYPPGEFVIPEVPPSTGAPIVLQIQGCQSLLSTTLASNATPAQIQAAADALIYQAALQQAQCDYIPQIPPLYGFRMTFSPISKPSACIGASYAAFISVFASNYPVTFTVTGGTLPPGITLSSSNNSQAFFTGTATTAGTYTFTIQGSAPDGSVGYKAYTIIVGGITTASPLTAATQNEVYSVTLAQTGFSGTLIWGIATGNLPDGLVINSATGEITGTPTTIETASFTVFVQSATQQCLKAFALEVVESNCEILTDGQLGSTAIDEAYSVQLTSLPVEFPLWIVTSGSLPTGLSLDGFTGLLSGTPTSEGAFIFTIQVSENCDKEFTLEVTNTEVISCITNSTDMGEYGIGSEIFIEPTPLDPPPIGFNYTWTIVSGALPDGITLSESPGPTGNLGGIVAETAAEGVYNFCIEVNEVPE